MRSALCRKSFTMTSSNKVSKRGYRDDDCKKVGLGRESNPEPLAPKARIIPLDHRAGHILQPVSVIVSSIRIPVKMFQTGN